MRHTSIEREKNWSIFSNSSSSYPPLKPPSEAPRALSERESEILNAFNRDEDYWKKRQKDDSSGIFVTGMTKDQMDDYLVKDQVFTEQEANRIAAINPEEIIYIDAEKWFDPKACEIYPSKNFCGDELYMTKKGKWIQKSIVDNEPSYDIVDRSDAFLFLEHNGYKQIAETINPTNLLKEV